MTKKEKKHEGTNENTDRQVQREVDVEGAAEQVGSADPASGGSVSGTQPNQAQDAGAVEARVEELTRDLQRLQAEFINYKRREATERGSMMDMAKRHVILDILPLLDNIDRALAHRPAELKDNAWAGGVEQIAKQADGIFAKLGVTKIEAVGQPFNHDLHEAISIEDGDGQQEVVVEEVQPGYRIGDEVLRHAMVKVAKK